MQIFHKLLFIFSLFLTLSCANQLPPTGGPTDKTPPVLLLSIPSQNQTLYTAKQMILVFDEYIQVQEFSKEFISSPALSVNPEFKILGKTLKLTWKESLLPNQTYTFFFGNAIRDLNEGNELQNLSITFSTGPDVDSIRLSGSVKQVISQEALAHSYVFLSEQPFHDSTFFPVNPLYQTKTNKEGVFYFQGIKPGTYFLYALEDKNANKQADNGEWLSFYSSPLVLNYPESDSLSDSVSLLSKPNEQLQLLAFPYYEPNKRIVKSVLSVANDCVAILFQDLFYYPQLAVYEKGDRAYHYFIKDTLFVKTKGDSVSQLEIRLKDKNNPLLFDSIPMLSKRQLFQWVPPIQSLFVPNSTNYNFQTNQKIMRVDSTKVQCKIDTVDVPFRVEKIGDYGIKIIAEKPGASVQLLDSAVVTHDSVYQKASYVIRRDADPSTVSGIWVLNIERESDDFKSKPLIIKIVGANTSHYHSLDSAFSKVNFTHLMPGEYTIEVIVDENNNGIWDTGDIRTYTPAEKIRKIEKPLQIKAGWEVESNIRL